MSLFHIYRTYSSSKGVLASPSWPGYNSYDHCASWKLKAGSNERIHLQIMDIKHTSVHWCDEDVSHLNIKGNHTAISVRNNSLPRKKIYI